MECAEKMRNSFYVDNLVTSVHSHDEYLDFRQQATTVMGLAKMELREWASSSDINTTTDNNISILGLRWDRERDVLSCDVKKLNMDMKITKRLILSTISQIFDPIGFTSPALLPPKRIFQNTWVEKLAWDDELPEDVSKTFKLWLEDMHIINEVKLPRHFQLENAEAREVHVFSDASKYAYAAAVFIRTEVNGAVNVQLLMAKSRLAPLKTATINRLELMSCVIAVRLAKVVKSSLNLEKVPFQFWTDSSTVLAWIRKNNDLGVFVHNRVKEILNFTQASQWSHVPGVANPADFPSRGCSPRQLLESTWWEGPPWLKGNRSSWPSGPLEINEDEVLAEMRKSTCHAVNISMQEFPEPRFSSYRKNVAVWGWVMRFVNACRLKNVEKRHFLSIVEMRQAEKIVLRKIQMESFPSGTTEVAGVQVTRDVEGLLRIQTRLMNRKDKHDFISPIVLPKCHPMVDLLIRNFHLQYCHAGIQFVMSKLREKYWIIHSRRTVRKVLKKCIKCSRFNAQHTEVSPSSLPEARVMDSQPFQTTGVDLAGPLFLRDGGKAWIVLYTCAVYRCVLLDVVTSLIAEAFLGSLERFVNNFGRPNTVFSDNGTNFVGAVSIFQRLNWKDIERACNIKQIIWRFNPPTAAWWGGWWERLIRSVKDLLKRMLGRAKLSFDELRTCLSGVSAVINDRPLTVITENGEDLIPLTPAMFIRGRVNGILPETINGESLSSSYKKMKNTQQQLQDRFRREYLSQLVQRTKKKPEYGIKLGDIVLVGSDNRKRFEWPLGLVTELIPGRDGKIRVARVKTKTGIFLRPLQRLYPSEVSDKEEAKTYSRDAEKVKTPVEEHAIGDPQCVTRKGRVVKVPRRYGQWMHLVNN
ncbi:unnamed protein product [Orchesella dallaii]|uniref:Integrase catalytic domain-containing protein n=1 Tax=Orchesella dallaii TaxID=48710 RepID=A0ABP1PP98_9HEXA